MIEAPHQFDMTELICGTGLHQLRYVKLSGKLIQLISSSYGKDSVDNRYVLHQPLNIGFFLLL